MNKKSGDNTSKLRLSTHIPRIKSLIKPPPPRSSWELLLNDYLKDPNFRSNFTPKTSPNLTQSTTPTSPPPTSIDPFQSTFTAPVYSPQFNQTLCHSCHRKSSLPARRYQMNLDEIVYLISQVGRADLYREMVQYIKTQPVSISTTHQASNMNACSVTNSNESFFLDHQKKKHSSDFSLQAEDKLTEKLTKLNIDKYLN